MTTLSDDLVPDELWALVEPLLPAQPRPPYGGRHRTISDRACLAAIVYMARTSTPWRLLPARELGCGSPATCWRRLTEWANAGVFDLLHLEVLDGLGIAGGLDWSRAAVDTMSVRAKRGGPRGRKSSRSWQAWKQAPPGLRRWRAALTAVVTAANVNDTTMSRPCWRTSRRSAPRLGGGAPDLPRSTPTRHPMQVGVKLGPAGVAVEAERTRCALGRAAGFAGNGGGSRAAG